MTEKIFYWTPRILTILAILFLVMFSFDVFGGTDPLWRQLLGFLVHNIPALILTGILVIAWKWETIGGISLIAVSIAGAIIFTIHSHTIGSVIVMSPFMITGILFLIHDRIFVKGKLSN